MPAASVKRKQNKLRRHERHRRLSASSRGARLISTMQTGSKEVLCNARDRGDGVPFEAVATELKFFNEAQASKPYSSRVHITENEIQRWSVLSAQSRTVMFDQIATYLARSFHNSKLSFESCNAIMNDIYGVIISAGESPPALFLEIYLAFDEGEHYHNDRRDEDPALVYTRSRIAQILEGLSSSP